MNIEKGFSYPDETTALSLIPPLVLGSATILLLTCLFIGVHCCYHPHKHSRRRSRVIYTRETNPSRIVPYNTHQYPVDTGKYSDIVIKTPKTQTNKSGTTASRIGRNLDSFKSTLTRPVQAAAGRGSPKPGLEISKSFEYAASDKAAAPVNNEQPDSAVHSQQCRSDHRILTSNNNHDLSYASLSFHHPESGASQQQTEIIRKEHCGDSSRITTKHQNTVHTTEEAFTSFSSDDRTLAYQSEPSFHNHQHLSLSAPVPRKSVPNVNSTAAAVEYSEIQKQPPPKKAPRSRAVGNTTAAAQTTFQSQHFRSAGRHNHHSEDGTSAASVSAAPTSTFETFAKTKETTSVTETIGRNTDDFRVVQTSYIHPLTSSTINFDDKTQGGQAKAVPAKVIKEKFQSYQTQQQQQERQSSAPAQKYSNSLSLKRQHQPDNKSWQPSNITTYDKGTDTVQSSRRSLKTAQFKNTKTAQQQHNHYESEGTVEVYNIATGIRSSIRVKDIRRKQLQQQLQLQQQQGQPEGGGEAAKTEETLDENKIIGEIIYKEIKNTINTSQLKTDV